MCFGYNVAVYPSLQTGKKQETDKQTEDKLYIL
jgi:hypothetical protein